MIDSFLIPVEEAARISGYKTVRKFRCAIQRGKMPEAYDKTARPQLWSAAQIKGMLPGHKDSMQDTETEEIKRRLGIG